MVVEKGSKVKVQYEGKLESGEVFDASNKSGEERPLEFVAGEGHVIKGFDNAVLGMEEGDEKDIEINPEEAYGERREEMKQEIPKSVLPQDKTPEKGMMLMMSSPQGQQMPAKIDEVKEDSIVIDLNHPLAGKKLLFKIKVVGIENAEAAAVA